jgi:hypothetical protein
LDERNLFIDIGQLEFIENIGEINGNISVGIDCGGKLKHRFDNQTKLKQTEKTFNENEELRVRKTADQTCFSTALLSFTRWHQFVGSFYGFQLSFAYLIDADEFNTFIFRACYLSIHASKPNVRCCRRLSRRGTRSCGSVTAIRARR